MCNPFMLQPVASSRDLFANLAHRNFVAEPDLAELLRDPMTEALMAADHVDRRELCALLSHVSETLR